MCSTYLYNILLLFIIIFCFLSEYKIFNNVSALNYIHITSEKDTNSRWHSVENFALAKAFLLRPRLLTCSAVGYYIFLCFFFSLFSKISLVSPPGVISRRFSLPPAIAHIFFPPSSFVEWRPLCAGLLCARRPVSQWCFNQSKPDDDNDRRAIYIFAISSSIFSRFFARITRRN